MAIIAFIVTVIVGIIGLFLDIFLNTQGCFCIILSISTMGAFIISAIEKTRTKY